MKTKMNNSNFIKAVSGKTGFTQKDIDTVFKAASEIILDNLKNDINTAVFQGMVIYPATYKDIKFPRARFGRFFKTFTS